MKTELQEQLYKDYPDLFQESKLDMTQTCMCWGIECGDGWEPIIRNMCKMISSRGTSYIRLRPIFPNADKLWMRLGMYAQPVLRWLERKLNLPSYKLKFPEIKMFEKFPGWEVRFTQIKEKFGTLRVYYDVYPRFTEEEASRFDRQSVAVSGERFSGYVEGVTCFAEYLSSKTCEKDGKEGNLTRSGWWKTLCSDCAGESNSTKDNNE